MHYKKLIKYTGKSLIAALCLLTPKIAQSADLSNNRFGSDMVYIGSQLLVSAAGSELQGTGGALYVLNSNGGGNYTTETTIGRANIVTFDWGRYMHLDDNNLIVYDGINGTGIAYDNNLNFIGSAGRATSMNSNGDMFGVYFPNGNGTYFIAQMANGAFKQTVIASSGLGLSISRPFENGIGTAAIGNRVFILGTHGGLASFTVASDGSPEVGSTINHFNTGGGNSFDSGIMTDGTTVVAARGTSLIAIRGSGSNFSEKSVGLPNSPDFTTGTSTRYDDVYVAGNRMAGVDDKGRAFLFQLPSDLSSGSIELIGVFDTGNVVTNSSYRNSVAIGNGQIAVGIPADTVNGEPIAGRVFIFNAP